MRAGILLIIVGAVVILARSHPMPSGRPGQDRVAGYNEYECGDSAPLSPTPGLRGVRPGARSAELPTACIHRGK